MQCINGHPNPPNQQFCGACGTALNPGFTPQAPTGNVLIAGRGTVQIATFGQRIAARVIDLVVIIAYPIILTTVMDWLSIPLPVISGSFLLFMLLYEWLCIGYAGATVGKLLMGIEVVDERTGERIGMGNAFVRQLIPLVGLLIFVVGAVLVYISPLFDGSGRFQGWHDKAANDLVIKAKD